jgi:hypothetical protein
VARVASFDLLIRSRYLLTYNNAAMTACTYLARSFDFPEGGFAQPRYLRICMNTAPAILPDNTPPYLFSTYLSRQLLFSREQKLPFPLHCDSTLHKRVITL